MFEPIDAPPAPPKKEGVTAEESLEIQGLGRSRGGFSTKIHLLCDGQARPMTATITAGQRHETTQVEALLDSVCVAGKRGAPRRRFENTAGDKAYDSEATRQAMIDRGSTPVIPRRGRTVAQQDEDFDPAAYRRRNVVERLVGRLKEYRAIATRYDKLKKCFHAMILMGFILIWMKSII